MPGSLHDTLLLSWSNCPFNGDLLFVPRPSYVQYECPLTSLAPLREFPLKVPSPPLRKARRSAWFPWRCDANGQRPINNALNKPKICRSHGACAESKRGCRWKCLSTRILERENLQRNRRAGRADKNERCAHSRSSTIRWNSFGVVRSLIRLIWKRDETAEEVGSTKHLADVLQTSNKRCRSREKEDERCSMLVN